MQKVTIKIEFSEILKHSYSGFISKGNYKHTIYLKNGSNIIIEGIKGIKSYKQLCRNFGGDHLDNENF
jgi:hypothetical protein